MRRNKSQIVALIICVTASWVHADDKMEAICRKLSTPPTLPSGPFNLPITLASAPVSTQQSEFRLMADGSVSRASIAGLIKKDSLTLFYDNKLSAIPPPTNGFTDKYPLIVRIEARSSTGTDHQLIACGRFSPRTTNAGSPSSTSDWVISLPQAAREWENKQRKTNNRDTLDVWQLTVFIDSDNATSVTDTKPKARTGEPYDTDYATAQADERTFIYRTERLYLNPPGSNCDATTSAPCLLPMLSTTDNLANDNVKKKMVELMARSQKSVPTKGMNAYYPVADSALKELLADEKILYGFAAPSESPAGLPFVNAWNAFAAKVNSVADSPLSKESPILTRPPDPPSKICQGALEFNLQTQPEKSQAWLFGTFDLPTTDDNHTLNIPSSNTASPNQKLFKLSNISAWVTRVKPDTTVTFSWVPGNSTATPIAQTLANFATAFVGKVPNTSILSTTDIKLLTTPECPYCFMTSNRPCLKQAEADKEKAYTLETVPTDSPAKLDIPAKSLLPMATSESHVQTSAAIGGSLLTDRQYVVYACSGNPCVTTTTGNNVIAQRSIGTRASWGLTLLGAIDFDARIPATGQKYGTQFTDYEWRQTAASGPAQVVYEIDEVPKPARSLSATLLLTLLSPEPCPYCGRWGIGAGPTIVLGDGSGSLRQWTGNLVWSPPGDWAKFVYVTTGFGGRALDTPLINRPGDTAVVTRSMGMAAAAPAAPQMTTTLTGVFTMGIALDLSAIGSAATAIFKTSGVPAGGSSAASTPGGGQ